MDKRYNIKDKICKNKHLPENAYSNYYIQKAQKLSIALHLITNLFPEKEPLRNAIRDKSICLLSKINNIETSSKVTEFKPSPDVFINIVSDIYLMLDVAKNVRLVSEMNHSILKREFELFLNADNPEISDYRIKKLPNRNDISKGHKNIKNNFSDFDSIKVKNKPSLEKNNNSRNERKKLIISSLNTEKGTSVKDISKIVKDCSEKTIQRELNSMSLKNEIRREGTRRWARYYLIK